MSAIAEPTAAPPTPVAIGWSLPAVLALVVVTLIAAALRLWGIREWSWNDDEAATWRALQLPLVGGNGFFAADESRAPLVHFALRWLVDRGLLPSLGEGAVRLPFAFVGIVAVPLLAVCGRRFVGTWPALLAALLLACHPSHVAASQTAAAPGTLALLWILLPRAVAAGRPFATFGLCLVAGFCDPVGWCAAPLVAASLLPTTWSRPFALAFGVAGVVFAAMAGSVFGLPLVLVAGVGLVLVPVPPAQLLVALVPVAASFVAPRDAAIAALPSVVLLAASGCAGLAARWQQSLPSRWASWVAWLPAAVVVVAVFVDAFLLTTLFAGGRPPWRDAARLVLRAGEGPRGLVVGAGVGCSVLTCYLRPRHWQEPDVDAHPLVHVVPVSAGDPASSLQQLLATANQREAAPFLVLAGPERERFLTDDAAAVLLAQRFRVMATLPAVGREGDESLFVLVPRRGD